MCCVGSNCAKSFVNNNANKNEGDKMSRLCRSGSFLSFKGACGCRHWTVYTLMNSPSLGKRKKPNSVTLPLLPKLSRTPNEGDRSNKRHMDCLLFY